MKYRILDQNGDYSFGRGQQNLTYGSYAVAQAIKTRLLLLQGEWWEDTSLGLPLFQQIIGQSGLQKNVKIADLLIQNVILNTPNVTGISEFLSAFQNRSYSFQCNVQTAFGDITVSKTF
jgi:hypothetical protein